MSRRWYRTAALALAASVGLGPGPLLAGLGPAAPLVGLGPSVALAAPAEPPALPGTGNGCVGPSAIVADRPSWAFRRVGPADVWPLTKGAGVTVAVVDTGVSPAGGGLSGGVVAAGADVVRGGRADSDCLGRGTALAALVAARPVGGSLFVGVAPEARVLPVRIVDGRGHVPPGAMAAGIAAATTAGADVILLGVGTPTPDAGLRAAVRAAIRRDVVVVAAVSDQKPRDNRPVPPWYPASDPDVLAVGGVAQSGAPTEAASPDSGLDLLAPGEQAYTVGPVGTGNYLVGGPAVAAAQVAAAAALVRAYHPDLDQAEVRRRLVGTGGGGLDVYAAVADSAAPETSVPPRAAPRLVVPGPEPVPARQRIAATVAAGTVLAAAVAALTVAAVRRGRRRRWRP
ncbi:S8 family serine peptidase [Micromonospora sp. NPDC049559]|uniref:S8 family serine peptidase n=1 Tax=Micromonospora sp. NPDC049559 TaxID=3155923 RepID=UPI00343CA94E